MASARAQPRGEAAASDDSVTAARDRLPFEQVYDQHSAAVYRFCVSQTGDPAAAEDLAADAFTAAFAAYGRIHLDQTALRPWLFRIARNAVIDHHRRRARARRLLVRLIRPDPPADVEEIAGHRGELRRVIAAMLGLSARDRQLLGLRLAAGLTFAEVASVMGMREATTRVACHRALRRLRGAVGPAPEDLPTENTTP